MGVDLTLVIDEVPLSVQAVALPETEEFTEAQARSLQVGDPDQFADRLGRIMPPVLTQAALDQVDGGGDLLDYGDQPLQLLLRHFDLVVELIVITLDRWGVRAVVALEGGDVDALTGLDQLVHQLPVALDPFVRGPLFALVDQDAEREDHIDQVLDARDEA